MGGGDRTPDRTPALESSGSIRVKKNSVQLIGLQSNYSQRWECLKLQNMFQEVRRTSPGDSRSWSFVRPQ